MIIVSDTSPVSNLLLIGRLELLRDLYQSVIVPKSVDEEIRLLNQFGKDISKYENADWINVLTPKDQAKTNFFKNILDPGEAEALAIALEVNCDLLLIDERIGTKVAHENGLKTLGLVGVLVKAKEEKLIPHIRPILEELRLTAGFWLADKFIDRVLSEVGEL